MAYNKVRVQLRNDSESNWLSAADQVLLSGEIAIVRLQNGLTKVKVGDGIHSFSQLHYLDEDELDTHHLSAIHISQGFNAQSSPTGIAGGAYVNANANFSQAFGYGASTKEGDDFSFVWNGKTDVVPGVLGGTDYESHGKGTFNINPLSGLSGFYIGDNNIYDALSDLNSTKQLTGYMKLSSETQQKVSSDVEIDGFVSVGSLSVGSQATEPFQRLKELMQQKLSRLDPETASTYDIVSALQSIYLGGSI